MFGLPCQARSIRPIGAALLAAVLCAAAGSPVVAQVWTGRGRVQGVVTDEQGKPKPWHHTLKKARDGTLAPWQPMGICATRDGSVYVTTIAPFTLLKFKP